MRKSNVTRIWLALAAAAVTVGCVVPINAQVLDFASRGGFYSGSAAKGGVDAATVLQGSTGGVPVAGFGGLDFYTVAPNSPLPGKTWQALSWGCLNPTSTNCANGGSSTTPWSTFLGGFDPAAAGRSSLEVLGLTGQLDAVSWTKITTVIHHNHVVGPLSNVLSTVDISSFLYLGNPPVPIDGPAGSITSVVFTETRNFPGQPSTNCASPGGVLGANPVGNTVGSQCDDFAFVSGLDLSPLFIPQGLVGNATPLQVNFRITSPGLDPNLPGGALVCGAPIGQTPNPDPLCNGYTGPPIVIYTAEGGNNEFSVEAQLSPVITTALFVIGDCESDQAKLKKGKAPPANKKPKKGKTPPADNNLREIGDEVNFWGAQWWKNNCMSVFTDNGYPAFKGYATNVNIGSGQDCGQWEARPGNSGHPPATLPDVINIIVTDNVMKDGPNISGNIKQIVSVDRTLSDNDNYAGNPGHQGWGKITGYVCGPVPAP